MITSLPKNLCNVGLDLEAVEQEQAASFYFFKSQVHLHTSELILKFTPPLREREPEQSNEHHPPIDLM